MTLAIRPEAAKTDIWLSDRLFVRLPVLLPVCLSATAADGGDATDENKPDIKRLHGISQPRTGPPIRRRRNINRR